MKQALISLGITLAFGLFIVGLSYGVEHFFVPTAAVFVFGFVWATIYMVRTR